MSHAPLVSVIIPHHNGRGILLRCLAALARDDSYRPVEVLVVDNASSDGSAEEAARRFPDVRLLRLGRTEGFAGGCNAGMRAAAGEFLVLLNNDAVVTTGWLAPLVRRMAEDASIAALQPKIRSLGRPGAFDYAGAAGGFLDVFGIPFARGRIFFTCEEDRGQYDAPAGGDIFWATGTCTLLRRSAVERVGGLDDSFFAHMEEIDLDWRMHLAGYRVGYVPESVVFHEAGTTLPPTAPLKIYLNHRNGLILLLKNYSAASLAWVLPARLALEAASAAYFLARRDLVQVRAIARALAGVAASWRAVLEARRRAQAVRVVSDREVARRMYRGSIVWQYFVRRRTMFAQVCGGSERGPARAGGAVRFPAARPVSSPT